MIRFHIILIVFFLSSCQTESTYEELFKIAFTKRDRWICFHKQGLSKGQYCIRFLPKKIKGEAK